MGLLFRWNESDGNYSLHRFTDREIVETDDDSNTFRLWFVTDAPFSEKILSSVQKLIGIAVLPPHKRVTDSVETQDLQILYPLCILFASSCWTVHLSTGIWSKWTMTTELPILLSFTLQRIQTKLWVLLYEKKLTNQKTKIPWLDSVNTLNLVTFLVHTTICTTGVIPFHQPGFATCKSC